MITREDFITELAAALEPELGYDSGPDTHCDKCNRGHPPEFWYYHYQSGFGNAVHKLGLGELVYNALLEAKDFRQATGNAKHDALELATEVARNLFHAGN
jgi:hypothetical protein